MISKTQLAQQLSNLDNFLLIAVKEQISPSEFRVILRPRFGSYMATIYPDENLTFIVRQNPQKLIAWRDVPNSAIIHVL